MSGPVARAEESVRRPPRQEQMVAWARGWPVVKIWMRGFVDRPNVVVVVEARGGEERERELEKAMPKISILVIVKAELTLTRGRVRDCGKHGF